ncbi:MAG: 50S ribosomal protein L22 [Proteobacteria bacterium]|nr:50S ribosomal protein L22 [Pseudomonadota bacterium]
MSTTSKNNTSLEQNTDVSQKENQDVASVGKKHNKAKSVASAAGSVHPVSFVMSASPLKRSVKEDKSAAKNMEKDHQEKEEKAAKATDSSKLPSFSAKLTGTPMSARKVRLVVNMIRGKSVDEAYGLLQVTHKKAAVAVGKLLASARSNAEYQGYSFDIPLAVVEAYVNEGPTRSRWRPRAQGRTYMINRRTCSIFLRLQQVSSE